MTAYVEYGEYGEDAIDTKVKVIGREERVVRAALVVLEKGSAL